MPPVAGDYASAVAVLEGELFKQSKYLKQWNKRYFKLMLMHREQNMSLLWWRTDRLKGAPLGVQKIDANVEVMEFPVTLGPTGFAVREHKGSEYPKDLLLLRGLSSENTRLWVGKLRESIENHFVRPRPPTVSARPSMALADQDLADEDVKQLRLTISVRCSGLASIKGLIRPLVTLHMNTTEHAAHADSDSDAQSPQTTTTAVGMTEVGRTEVAPSPVQDEETVFHVTLTVTCPPCAMHANIAHPAHTNGNDSNTQAGKEQEQGVNKVTQYNAENHVVRTEF